MYNLRKILGTLKGDVGEAIFLALNKYAHGTKFDSYDWLEKVPFTIPESFVIFLKNNWATIDAFEFEVNHELAINITFYEVKTVNFYSSGGVNFGKKPFITKNASDFYKMAMSKGFKVKTVLIILYEGWNFEVQSHDFNIEDFQIHDGNSLYSRKVQDMLT
jgi:hypothetical protein